MPKFRKKPIVIEAIRFDGSNSQECATWCGGRANFDPKPSDHTDVFVSISIPTLEGVMIAITGDWIIRGVKGEFYPCKPDIFEATYEAAE